MYGKPGIKSINTRHALGYGPGQVPCVAATRGIAPSILRSRVLRSRALVYFAATLLSLFLATPAAGATSSTGTTAVVCNVANSIETSFPSQVTFGDLVPANTGYHETVIQATVRSNAPWKLVIRCDQPDGKMREWNGTAYAENGGKLSFPLNWKLAGQPASAYKAITSQDAVVLQEAPATGAGGRTVSIDLGQKASYDDLRLAAAGSSYQMIITFTATHLY